MLNNVLRLLKRKQIFDLIDLQESQQLILDIIKIGRNYDCNSGEIIEDFAEEFRICNYCLSTTHMFSETGCPVYSQEFGTIRSK